MTMAGGLKSNRYPDLPRLVPGVFPVTGISETVPIRVPAKQPQMAVFIPRKISREIIQYAQERNITIVPEIDVPGHSMAAIAAYPELSCTKGYQYQGKSGNQFCRMVW